MNTIKKIGVILLCAIVPAIIYSQIPRADEQTKPIEETKVILVNQDEGVTIDGVHHNFSQNLIDVFIEESDFDAVTTNYTDAMSKLENNEVMYIIVFEAQFSKKVNNYDTENPEAGVVQYYYNHTYNNNDGKNVDIENNRSRIFTLLQDELSQVYMKTIVAELNDSKNMLAEDIQSDIELVDDIKETSSTNSSSIENQIASNNEFVSELDNNMGEKISEVNSAISEAKDVAGEIIDTAESGNASIEEGKALQESMETTVEANYLAGYDKYKEITDIVSGDNGVVNKTISDYIPVYTLYDNQSQENLKVLESINAIDQEVPSMQCGTAYIAGNYGALRTYLSNLTMKEVNSTTKELEEVALFGADEIEQIIVDSQTACKQVYTMTRAETNSTVNASGIELLYAEIIEESEGKLEYYRNKEGLIV
ncbi:MAG: hypothetical protein ACK5LZ_05350, partial [Anaerorhabdus sp.]